MSYPTVIGATAVTAAAVAATFLYTPPTASSGTTPTVQTPTATAPSSGPVTPVSGTVTGPAVSTDYGPVQVQVERTCDRITNISVIAAPDADRQSVRINANATPQLVSQALASQSADISGVSGATYTTQGFQTSLQKALMEPLDGCATAQPAPN